MAASRHWGSVDPHPAPPPVPTHRTRLQVYGCEAKDPRDKNRTYKGFCGGGGYMISPDVIRNMTASQKFYGRYMHNCALTEYCDITTGCAPPGANPAPILEVDPCRPVSSVMLTEAGIEIVHTDYNFQSWGIQKSAAVPSMRRIPPHATMQGTNPARLRPYSNAKGMMTKSCRCTTGAERSPTFSKGARAAAAELGTILSTAPAVTSTLHTTGRTGSSSCSM